MAEFGEFGTQSDDAIEVRYEISRPVDLVDLTKSLLAVAAEYQKFAAAEIDPPFGETMRLQVKEIRSGSIIASLVPYAAGMLPLISDINTVVSFGGYVGSVVKGLLDGASGSKSVADRATLQNVNDILEPVAKDHAAQLNINQMSGDVYLNVTSQEANAAQNEIKRRLADLGRSTTGYHDKVVLHWYQARHDLASKAGDKAIIESISPKPVKTLFATDSLKARMLYIEQNPFEYAYLVDVMVETVNDRPALYKVLDFHDRLDIDD